jgi:hypothetical protein
VETDEDIRMENGAYVHQATSPTEENPYLSPKIILECNFRYHRYR